MCVNFLLGFYMKTSILILTAISLTFCAGAYADDYTCNPQDNSTMGIVSCNLYEYQSYDALLNKAYKSAEKACNSGADFEEDADMAKIRQLRNKECISALKTSQLSWIKFRDNFARYKSIGEGSITQILYSSFLAEETKKQAYALIPLDDPDNLLPQFKALEQKISKLRSKDD